MTTTRFDDKILVTCEALRPEIERLRSLGQIDFREVYYVHPGSHERPHILEEQLPGILSDHGVAGKQVVAALGSKCYLDLDNPDCNIDALLGSFHGNVRRVRAEDCVDMLAEKQQRTEAAGGRSIYWMTPGWVVERNKIFEGWDHGKANETFPRHDAVVLVDAIDYFNTLSMENPEELLEFSDWLGVGLEPATVDLERFQYLLTEAADAFDQS